MKLYVLNRNIKFTFLWDKFNTIETVHFAGLLSKSVSIHVQLIQSNRILLLPHIKVYKLFQCLFLTLFFVRPCKVTYNLYGCRDEIIGCFFLPYVINFANYYLFCSLF